VGGADMTTNMTKEEVEKKFPVGTRVKVISPWDHKQHLQGEIGTISEIRTFNHGSFLCVDWDKVGIEAEVGDEHFPWRFEPIGATTTKVMGTAGSSVCPRCNGALFKKEAEEPFTGKKYMIDKCSSCGWC
jgi:hypothetical protein